MKVILWSNWEIWKPRLSQTKSDFLSYLLSDIIGLFQHRKLTNLSFHLSALIMFKLIKTFIWRNGFQFNRDDVPARFLTYGVSRCFFGITYWFIFLWNVQLAKILEFFSHARNLQRRQNRWWPARHPGTVSVSSFSAYTRKFPLLWGSDHQQFLGSVSCPLVRIY